jgi:hypothetical protein
MPPVRASRGTIPDIILSGAERSGGVKARGMRFSNAASRRLRNSVAALIIMTSHVRWPATFALYSPKGILCLGRGIVKMWKSADCSKSSSKAPRSGAGGGHGIIPSTIQELSKIIDLVNLQQYCSAQFPF